MIIKSFFRKKSTKIYLVIFTLIFLVMGILLISKGYYLEKYNYSHRYDKIIITNNKNFNLNDIENILSVDKVIKTENDNTILINNHKIKDNDILISDKLKDDYKIGEKIIITYYGNDYNLNIVGYSEYLDEKFIYASSKIINTLNNIKPSNDYSISLKNWLKDEETIKKIKYDLDFTHFLGDTTNSGEIYKEYLTIITIFITLFIICFILVGIITLFNFIKDEKNNNVLYKFLGYRKSIIIFSIFIKLALIILISILFSSIPLLIIVKYL